MTCIRPHKAISIAYFELGAPYSTKKEALVILAVLKPQDQQSLSALTCPDGATAEIRVGQAGMMTSGNSRS